MKKELSILSLALAPALGMAGTLTATGAVRTTDCSLLQDNLTIQLSSGVQAGWICNTTTTNTLSIAACHTSGRIASRSATATNCGTGTASAQCTTVTTTATGAVVPAATTGGGSMQFRFPGSACTAGVAEGQATAINQ